VGTARLPRSQQKTAIEWSLAVRKKNPRLGVGNAFADSTDLRRLNPPSELSLASTLAAMKRLFMDSEACLVPPRPRWTRHSCSSRWEGISALPGPHQQGKLTAMSGHIATTRARYMEVLGTQFNPDAAPSSVNMTMDLGASQNLLKCDLTKAVWWYRPSPGEGKPDCQSLFGRLGWSEEIANPSPLDGQSNSRAKWVGKTGFYRSRHTTACVELSSAVHSKTSEIGVGDAPPAFSLLISHLCTYRRGRSVGAFSSVRRADRLRIANGHTGNRVSDIRKRLLGCRRTNFTASSTRVQARRVMSLQRPVPAFSDWNASGLDPQGVAVLTDGMSCPALSVSHQRTPSSGVSRGTHGFLVLARDPWGSAARAAW
jgi:hypothetical protein